MLRGRGVEQALAVRIPGDYAVHDLCWTVSRSRLAVTWRLKSLSLERRARSVRFSLLSLSASFIGRFRLRITYFCDISSLS